MAGDALCNRLLSAQKLVDLAPSFAQLERELRAYEQSDREPLDPITAYIYLFRAVPDPYIQTSVERLYQQRVCKGVQRIRSGFVYVFWVHNDGPNIVKIGSTEHTPERRVATWRRELGASFEDLSLLFAFETHSALFSEYVLHEVLRCERIVNRVNRRKDRRLTEYFLIKDVRALRKLCKLVVRHTNWFVQSLLQNLSSNG